jgi:protein-S-isoprenylcysteine O-methyltransferase Ste14
MAGLALVVVGMFLMFGVGAVARYRAVPEFTSAGRVSRTTFVAATVAYCGLGLCTVVAAWRSEWPLSMSGLWSRPLGGVMLGIGATIYALARTRFGLVRLTWGLELDRLVTSGIYRFSRHPQALGMFLVLGGTAIVGRSAAGLALCAGYAVATAAWVPVEERILECRFGEAYRRYRNGVPKYIGLPPRSNS